MSKYKAVLFDFDGTLIDTNEVILGSWQHLYDKVFGQEISLEDVRHTFGEILHDTLAKRFPDKNTDELVEIYREYARDFYEKDIEIFPGIRKMLDELDKEGIKKAIVTSRYWGSLTQGNYIFDIADRFDEKVTCEDTAAHKPDPEPINICLKKMGLNPDEVLYAGDTLFDLNCAHNARVKFILVGWSVALPKDEAIGDNAPDFYANTPEEIAAIAAGKI